MNRITPLYTLLFVTFVSMVAACSTPSDIADSPAIQANEATEAVVHAPPAPEAELDSFQVTGSRLMQAGKAQTYGAFSPAAGFPLPSEPLNRENYHHFDDNPLRAVTEHPVSTFSIDVDTASYANVRRLLNAGQLPPQDAVRTEELINYFDFSYPAPDTTDTPFSVTTRLAPTPWNDNTHLLMVGIQGYEPPKTERPPANLVFLIDVSGSMNALDKLPLLKNAMQLLTDQLRDGDRIAIAVYAGAAGTVLESTPGSDKAKIRRAINNLHPGGATNGAAGIRLAYELAQQGHIQGGINRVLLATDGDFNVGTVNFEDLIDLVERRRDSGIGLSTLGFGTGNYNDHLTEQLANQGDGMAFYIDSLKEARKVLVEEVPGTLMTIAKDVKLQIEFNPAEVSEYRLVGYENRVLDREDFDNDKVDAGEIGAGHTVTALYEIALADSGGERLRPLRYQSAQITGNDSDEFALLAIRYKQPDAETSQLLEFPITRDQISDSIAAADDDLRFAAAVAAFGQQLRGGKYLEDFDYDDIRRLARSSKGRDPNGYRGEFIQLLGLAESLDQRLAGR